MSGGSLHGYYNLERIAEEIERMIIDQRDMGPEIIGRYKTAVALCRAAFHAVKAVDYLDSGDYGRESFVVAWDEYVRVGPADVLVALSRPEGYEDVHPEIILDDAHIHPAFRARVVGGAA